MDEPVELIRINSARPATRKERKRYEAAKNARDTLLPLTEALRDNLKHLAAKPDDETDTSDIPELTDAQVAKMKRHGHCRPVN